MENFKKEDLVSFKDKKNKTSWFYIPSNKMQEFYPEGDYIVSGEVAKNKMELGGVRKEISSNLKASILARPNGNYNESQYKTIGYIPCKEDKTFIAVKKRKKAKWFSLLLLPLFIAMGLLIGNFMQKDKFDLDPNIKDFESTLKRPADIESTKILVPGYERWTMKTGSDVIQSTLFNPEGNPCFFKFTIIEKETGNVLFESKLVPPGKAISPIKLNKTFEKGSYPLLIKFKTIDLEDGKTEYNGSDVDVTLNVE